MLMLRVCAAVLSLLLGAAVSAATASDSAGLARTPPMGWSTWYGLRCNYDAADLRDMADRLVSTGLGAAGYSYLNVDDCWATARDQNGRLVADPARFPGGLKPLGDYIHSKGLRFGVYTSAGTTTCQRDLQANGQRLPIGSRGSEFADARQFAEMGADFVKVDWCGHHPIQDGPSSYATWRDAIAATGRPMLLSICEWGYSKPWMWARNVGQQWRIAMDTLDCWSCTTDWGGIGVVTTFDRLAAVAEYGGADGWNDPDNLLVGKGVLTLDEERAQMSVYAVAAAPLILAADLRRISKESLAVIANRAVIAVNQDPLGKPGRRVRSEDGDEMWVRDLTGGRRAVLLLNRSDRARKLSLQATELGLGARTALTGRELWTNNRVEGKSGRIERLVAGHGVALIVLEPPTDSRVVRPPV